MTRPMARTLKIILLDTNETLCNHWRRELKDLEKVSQHKSLEISQLPLEIIVHHGPIDALSKYKTQETWNSTIVAPGNSVGFLGGGFDLAIAKYFDASNWKQFESHFQKKLFKVANGYTNRGQLVTLDLKNDPAWEEIRCDSVLHLPTMKVPSKIYRNAAEANQLIFDLTWDMLTTLSSYNEQNRSEKKFINTVIVPGLGTGYGAIPLEICAKSMCYAIYIYATTSYTELDRARLCLRYVGADYRKLFPTDQAGKYDFQADEPTVLFGEDDL